MLERVGRSFRAIAADQRGHGRSDKPATGYGADDFADDVAGLITAVGARSAVVVGHSLGARNAFAVAARRPELIAGVVAIDFTPFIEAQVFDALEARVRGGDRTFDSLASVEAYLRARYPRLPADAIARRATHGYREVDGRHRPWADAAAMAQTVQGLRAPLEPAVRRVECPVLLVRGALSTLVSEEAFGKTLELRQDFSPVVVSDADHYVPEEAPSAIADAVLRLATAVDRRAAATIRGGS